jgi:NCAIR mutase (PurE)-related protein
MMQHDNLDLDHDRQQRCGFPEVVYGAGKTPEEIVSALTSIADRANIALATRVDDQVGADIASQIDGAQWHHRCRCISIDRENRQRQGQVTIICAGSSDLPVAQEARLTADLAGACTEVIPDAGVAGIHRILAHDKNLRSSNALIVVAGMEGALPSVVAGRVAVPVIAVPTSIGYGAAFGGITALLGMLCSCSAGISVVNIDNGFGAGIIAARINRLACEGGPASGR